jgi:perosamine synthetase
LIPYGKHHLDDEDIQAVVAVMRSNYLTQGPVVEAFEKAIATYTGAKYVVAVSNGTAALHLAALALSPIPGSSFVTSPITFVASANAARYVGCNVLFADIEPTTVNMSPVELEKVVAGEKNVSAIVPVHFGGLPCNMADIGAVAGQAGIPVIEDAAHALGARYEDGGKVGSCRHSLMTIFSFHPVKAIACGEGGLITTNDEIIYRRLLRLRSHGINKEGDTFEIAEQAETEGEQNPWYYEMQELGFNYRLTDIQSALGLSQLKKLDNFINRRKALANSYDVFFAGMEHCRAVQSGFRERSGNHLYVVDIDFRRIGSSRARLIMDLRQQGIGSQVHYIPVPCHPYYRSQGHDPGRYPNAMAYYDGALSIPLFFDLDEKAQEKVCDAFRDLVG